MNDSWTGIFSPGFDSVSDMLRLSAWLCAVREFILADILQRVVAAIVFCVC